MTDRRCVVVGDVVKSREASDRDALRRRLNRGLQNANDAIGDETAATFATLKGVDELGGVLATPARAYPAVREIVEAVHPTSIRFAVVWDRVDVGIGSDDVAEMDGPAFHEADALLDDLAASGRFVALSVDGADGWVETLIGNQMDLLSMWKYEWTARQAETARQYRTTGSMQAVAERRDVSVQAVSQMLARANVSAITAIEADLESAMATLWGDLP